MMTKIPIYIVNTKFDDLGIDQDDKVVEFHVKLSSIDGFWQDPDTGDINIYACGQVFQSPYSDHLMWQLEQALNLKQ